MSYQFIDQLGVSSPTKRGQDQSRRDGARARGVRVLHQIERHFLSSPSRGSKGDRDGVRRCRQRARVVPAAPTARARQPCTAFARWPRQVVGLVGLRRRGASIYWMSLPRPVRPSAHDIGRSQLPLRDSSGMARSSGFTGFPFKPIPWGRRRWQIQHMVARSVLSSSILDDFPCGGRPAGTFEGTPVAPMQRGFRR